MSDRINNLRKEAKGIAFDLVSKNQLGLKGLDELYEHKFAELIIKECSQLLENHGMVEVATEIKQHFGFGNE